MKSKNRFAEKKVGGGQQLQLSFSEMLELSSQRKSISDCLKGLLAIKETTEQEERIMALVPLGSILEDVIREFSEETNIPLEIPMSIVFSIISGQLCQNNVKIEKNGRLIDPSLWFIILASSGAGKTFTWNTITSDLGTTDPRVPGMAGIVSAAALFSVLLQTPRGLMVRDEFAQLIKQVETNPSMQDIKDYLLRIYDGGPIERTSKKEGVFVVDNIAISILGLSVYETWHKSVSTESMLDGFAQRFLYVVAKPDPKRRWQDFPEWKINLSKYKSKWENLEKITKENYYISETGQELFETCFRSMCDDDCIPESFFRRVLWASHKIAVIYHILLSDDSDVLSGNDYAWAARLIIRFLQDSKKVIGEVSMGELSRVINKSQRIVEKRSANGKETTPRDLIAGVQEIKTANEAKAIFNLLDLDQKSSFFK